ncbi:SAM-dependent methyltransferase [Jatrophihabitans fulvus]
MFDAAYWDERYRSSPSVWGRPPNRFVEAECSDLAPGTAIDLACGEGRNALWLAARGWRVLAVDFSQAALAKGAGADDTGRVTWVLDDALEFRAPAPVDLIVVAYLQLPPDERRRAMRNAVASLAPGGTLLVVAHDARNRSDGTGGPQDPAVLYTARDVEHDLESCGLVVERADEVLRPVPGADRPAIDCLYRARRPTGS